MGKTGQTYFQLAPSNARVKEIPSIFLEKEHVLVPRSDPYLFFSLAPSAPRVWEVLPGQQGVCTCRGGLWGCQCGKKQRSQNPLHNLAPGLGFAWHGSEQLSTTSTSCPLPCGGDLFSQLSEQLSSTGHLYSWDYFVTGQFGLSPRKRAGGGLPGFWISTLLRCA